MCIWNSMTLSTEAFKALLCKYIILDKKQNIVQNNIDNNNTLPTPTRTHTLTQATPTRTSRFKHWSSKKLCSVKWLYLFSSVYFKCFTFFHTNCLGFNSLCRGGQKLEGLLLSLISASSLRHSFFPVSLIASS